MSVSAAFILMAIIFFTLGVGMVVESFKRTKYRGLDVFKHFWLGMFLIGLGIMSGVCAIKYYVPN